MTKTSLNLVAASLIATQLNATDFKDLGVITITSATKSEQSIQDVTANVEVITGAELEEKHITTVLDALRLSGISISQSGGLGQLSSFFMGGMSAEHTLVLVNGIRYNDPTTPNGQAQLDHLMIANIDRIEIIKGAQSGIWGADAVAGVINIITKQQINTQELLVNLEVGSFQTKKFNLNISGKDERQRVSMGVSAITSDGFSAIVPKDKNLKDYEDDKYENTTVNFQYGLNINETNKIDFVHTIIDSKGDYDSSWSGGANDMTSTFTNKNKFTALNFNHIDSFNIFDIYANRSTFDRTYAGGEYVGETKEIGIKSKIPYRVKDFILVGLDSKKQIMEKSYSVLNGKYESNGIFATNSNTFGNTILTQSLRYDQYDNYEDKTTGKIGLKQVITPDLKLFLNYATAYKTPSLYNLYAGYGSGNLNLKPEDVITYDGAIEYKNLKLSYFQSDIENLIDYKSSKYQNLDGVSTYKGYEVSYKSEIIDNMLLDLKYKYQSAKDKDGNDLERREKQRIYAGFDYYGVDSLSLHLNGEYVGERYDDKAKTKQTGRYTVWNASANYDYKANLKFYCKIENLTDKKYQIVDGYATSPRAYYVGLNATF